MWRHKKAGCDLVKNNNHWGGMVQIPDSDQCECETGRVLTGQSGLTCLANLPRMYKGYVNQCHCPFHSPAMASSLHSAVKFRFSCVCLVLLFSPVCWVLHSLSISWASHIRRTSGVRHQEWSPWGTIPLPPLFVSLYLPPFSSSLPLPLALSFLSAHILHPILVIFSFSNSVYKSPEPWPSLNASDPLYFMRLHYICQCAQRSSGWPIRANIPQHASQWACN